MQINISLLLVFSLAILGISCVSEKAEPESIPEASTTHSFPTPTTEIDEKRKTTTTVSPSTSEIASTSTTVSTTSSTTSTTTEAPITSSTTAKPSVPTTTVAPASSTTVKPPVPTTTVAPVPTTTAKPPAPLPPPAIGNWSFTENNKTCIIAQMAIQLNVTYTTTENKTENVLYNVPANETSEQSGNCGNDTNDQQIVVKWGPQYTQSNFLLLFSLNKSTNVFALKEFVINLNTNELPKGKNESLVFYHSGNIFNAPRDMSYHCTKVQYLNLAYDEKSNKSVASARLSHVQLEAYHKTHDNKFSVAKDCDAIDTPDIVPIAVGCALIALVVVVLIAYIVGRRRAQARGYVSM